VSVASIKGAVAAMVAERVVQLVDKGSLSEARLIEQLDESERQHVEAGLPVAAWVPVDLFDRLMQLACEAEGCADPDLYYRINGRVLASRLRGLGLYPQLERREGEPCDGRAVKRTLTLWSGVVSFSRWHASQVADEPLVFEIEVTEASDFTPRLRIANAGFLEGVFAHLARAESKVEITTDEPARLVYRLTIPRA